MVSMSSLEYFMIAYKKGAVFVIVTFFDKRLNVKILENES
jgi:hypothetical protein